MLTHLCLLSWARLFPYLHFISLSNLIMSCTVCLPFTVFKPLPLKWVEPQPGWVSGPLVSTCFSVCSHIVSFPSNVNFYKSISCSHYSTFLVWEQQRAEHYTFLIREIKGKVLKNIFLSKREFLYFNSCSICLWDGVAYYTTDCFCI